MKIYLLAFFLAAVLVRPLCAQTFSQSYYNEEQFGLTSPGAMKYGLYGYVNPAILADIDQGNIYFAWTDAAGKWSEFNNWGLFASIPNLGFDIVHQDIFGDQVTNYKLSAAFGSRAFSYGIGYGWSNGNASGSLLSDVYTLGVLVRPNRYLSLGIVGNLPTRQQKEGILDLAVRPLGTELISLFGDYVVKKNVFPGENTWSAGAAIEAVPGIRITGRYFESKFFSLGVDLSLGRVGFTSGVNFNDAGKRSYNIYGVRVGAYDRNPLAAFSSKDKYVDLNLLGPLKYQKYRYFDNSNTLLNLIEEINAAQKDRSIAGIVINTSGMKINYEMIWELRQKLSEFKAAGKHVVIYVDRPDIETYYLASVANKIVMDPQGIILLQGFLFGRQYYKNTLQKLGIGFHEWRYFKYKSAFETFSRDKMSEADSAQWQSLIDDFYSTAKSDICSGRNIQPSKFDELVNSRTIFLADDALKYGLVDAVGRWDTVKKIVKELDGSGEDFVKPGSLDEFNLPHDNYWGEKPRVAVIYALGICAMDEGITARKLVKDVEAAAYNRNIKAVVLRVDSPGGDGLASDIIAEAIKKCREFKPVIVSQGEVAASGGYWLSMYADTIVAAPNTMTGSIGVIGGWAYNKGFDSMIGVTTSHVQVGAHADLGFGFTFPFLGITLPDRDLTPDEQAKAESSIETMYHEFVGKVAAARNRSYSYIDSIGQGRVWSGTAGFKNGLVDVIGGLSTAIKIAAEKAGLKGCEYDIAEFPKPGLFNFSSLLPKFSGFGFEQSGILNDLKFRFKNNGRPMPMLPLEDMIYTGE